MKITYEEGEQAYILRLNGELDASTCLELDREIEMALCRPIEQLWIDFEELKYISSAGLGVMISHLGSFEARNINLVLYGMSDHVRNVFELLGLHMLMTIVPSKKEAELQVK
ncbi:MULTISPECIES: STAS domain-containing protein [Rufibacter]|uniref:Anti-sigma factor antagonist n=1 Tax=Rufibacter quisquiliarum TaxID=1549639 RepID=A0A839GUK1_9BACT|nr:MULTISPECIES: STAS domain-containing protein [Rufibacter]MBA9079155.1 anti-sigma B factor antagonist [Rufibacter quisquiliarum]